MSAIDIGLLLLAAYFATHGFMRGLTGEIFALLGVVASFYCSMTFNTPFARFLSAKWNINPLLAATASIVVIFLAVMILCAFIGAQIRKLLKRTHLSGLDSILGCLTGLLKTILIVLAILVVCVVVSPLTGSGWVRHSRILMGTAQVLPAVYPPLEEMGLVPNIEELRLDAANFIMSRTMNALTGETASGDAELAEASDESAKRLQDLVKQGQSPAPEPEKLGGAPPPKDNSYSRRFLEYFIGLGE